MIEIIILVVDQYKEIEKIAISITKSWNKTFKLILYNKVVNNPIHDCK